MNSAANLITTLSARIDEVLGTRIPPGMPCALVDFPSYTNAGDSAIWMGEWVWLQRNGNPVPYVCDIESYDRNALAERLGAGIILLSGGGNFGDLWVKHQRFREQVVLDFPNHKIIQLPQSIHFDQEMQLQRSRSILRGHPDFTLLCRDQASFGLARQELQVNAALCPDMAFALGNQQHPVQPAYEIMWLARADKESRNQALPHNLPGVWCTDWLEEEPTDIYARHQQLQREAKGFADSGHPIYESLIRTYNLLAVQRLRRGCRILNQGRIVITDRLHGHIVCLLLGIPHVLLDNSYGKVRGFYDAWTAGNPLTVWAKTPEEAVTLALDAQKLRSVLPPENQAALERVITALKASLGSNTDWETPQERDRKRWQERVEQMGRELAGLSAPGEKIILVDEDQLRYAMNSKQEVLPFPENRQLYGGPPADDQAAIMELKKLSSLGANLVAIAWPAFWWLDHYKEWAAYLQAEGRVVLKNERLVVFKLNEREQKKEDLKQREHAKSM